MQFEVLEAPAHRLGECPLWCERTQRLWWVDVLAGELWSCGLRGGACERHPVKARRIGSLALRQSGGLILACDDGLHLYDPEERSQSFLIDPEPHRPGHRKNDGRVDPAGNFWVGTLREADYAPIGALYRISAGPSFQKKVGDLAIPNGLAFDPDRGRMYYADTRAYTIWVCDFEPGTGCISNQRVFAKTNAPARPDGSCIDAEGHVWNAEYAGGKLVRYAPDGEIADIVELPVTFPTCCCFGGEKLDQIVITSASEPLGAADREREPLAGRTLVLQAGTVGRSEYLSHI